MPKLRIAMICDMIPGQPGGSYISTLRFAELLIKEGHHIIIVAAKDKRVPEVSTFKGVPIYQFFSLPTPGSNRYYFQSFPTKKELRKLFKKEQIQIVHTMFPSYSCLQAKKVAQEMNLPVVAHIHTQPENVSIFLPSFLRKKFIDNLILRYLVWFIKGANRIICPSELGKHIYQTFDPSLEIDVISNGINLSDFHQMGTGTTSNKNILFIGRLTKEKDPETLLQAIPEIILNCPSAHFVFIGIGPLAQELSNLAKKLSITERVKFLGKISDEGVLSALNACDLFVLPSRVELEGMVVLEAMAFGKPILIANSETSASKYFVKDNGYVFKVGDSHDLAEKAIKILNNDSLRKAMGEESLREVKNFDINVSVKKLEEVYLSLI